MHQRPEERNQGCRARARHSRTNSSERSRGLPVQCHERAETCCSDNYHRTGEHSSDEVDAADSRCPLMMALRASDTRTSLLRPPVTPPGRRTHEQERGRSGEALHPLCCSRAAGFSAQKHLQDEAGKLGQAVPERGQRGGRQEIAHRPANRGSPRSLSPPGRIDACAAGEADPYHCGNRQICQRPGPVKNTEQRPAGCTLRPADRAQDDLLDQIAERDQGYERSSQHPGIAQQDAAERVHLRSGMRTCGPIGHAPRQAGKRQPER